MWDIDTHIGTACIAVADPWEGCGTVTTAAQTGKPKMTETTCKREVSRRQADSEPLLSTFRRFAGLMREPKWAEATTQDRARHITRRSQARYPRIGTSRTARTHPRYGSVNTFGSDTVGLPDR